jgi:hypothetical protein
MPFHEWLFIIPSLRLSAPRSDARTLDTELTVRRHSVVAPLQHSQYSKSWNNNEDFT